MMNECRSDHRNLPQEMCIWCNGVKGRSTQKFEENTRFRGSLSPTVEPETSPVELAIQPLLGSLVGSPVEPTNQKLNRSSFF